MGTGIVSIAVAMDKQAMLSRVTLAIAAVTWIVLGIVLCWRLARYRAAG